jgi:hypothetical protein
VSTVASASAGASAVASQGKNYDNLRGIFVTEPFL